MIRSGLLLLAPCVAACASASAQPEVPAVIDPPSRETRAELAQAISTALDGAPVTLAGDALTRDSLLIIEKAHLNGRDFGKPEQFRLLKAGNHCVLVHERTGRRTTLPSTSCQPLVP